MRSSTSCDSIRRPLPAAAWPRRWAVALCLLLGSPWGQAQTLEAPLADMRVVIDVSGSMKKSDPANLRKPSLELLLQLLPDSSRAGVWTFGEGVNPLVSHGEVTADWKRKALELSGTIGSSDLYTHLGAALDEAAFDRLQPPDRQTHILLLTDGMVDIDKNPQRNGEERQRIVDRLLPQLQQAGYTVHTIALSDHADRELLDQLAQATGGVAAVAKSADTLMKAFVRVFDQTAPAEQLPLTDNRFWVDSSIKEFTALVFRRPGSAPVRLTDPAGTIHAYSQDQQAAGNGMNWHRTEQYDLITVTQPERGEWQVLADIAPESRVTIVSNLKLAVQPLPHQASAGQPLGLAFQLQERGGPLTSASFLDLLEIDGQLVQEVDGEEVERWRSPLNNDYSRTSGVYRSQVEGLTEEGDYRLKVVVDGKTFQRQFTHYLRVRNTTMAAPIVPATPKIPAAGAVKADRPPAASAAPSAQRQASSWVLFAILGGGNLLLIMLGVWAYRVIMGKARKTGKPVTAVRAVKPAPVVWKEADEPILPIELDVVPEPEPLLTPEPPAAFDTPAATAQPDNEPVLNEREVDALFAELEGNWEEVPAPETRS